MLEPRPAAFTINPGDRIAQMVIVPVVQVAFEVVEDFSAPRAARAASGARDTAERCEPGANLCARRRNAAGDLGDARRHARRSWQFGTGRATNDRARSCSTRAPRRCPMRSCWRSCCVPARRGRSALDLARDVLKSFHSLRKLIAADRQRFCAERGLGLGRYAELQAAAEISRRQLSEIAARRPFAREPAGDPGLSDARSCATSSTRCFAVCTSISAIA